MKKYISAAAALVLSVSAVGGAVPQKAFADNPMVQTIYSTDPAPVVFGDEVYVYTGRDKDNSSFYYMPDWHCYSSKDMQNWTDHGTILSWSDFSWGKEDSAWASQCIERNGKYYYYVTLDCKSGGGRAIGVAVADSPSGPFKDALGKPLCGPNWDYIDPTIFIDDDGQAWLMFGNPTCYYVKLNEDMISYQGQIQHFEMTTQAFGQTSGDRKTSYGEGPWFYKRGNLYYLMYAAFGPGNSGEDIRYSTAPTPTGPWTYRGVVMNSINCFTNHSGVVDFKGKSYFFYHDASLPGGGSFDRSTCVEEFSYNADGTIPTIKPTKNGPAQIQPLDPFERVEAETICWSSGIKTESCSEGGINIANIENNDYIKVKGVDFGNGADKFTASVASATDGGKIEIHLDSTSGKLIGTCEVPATGGWQKWKEVSCDVDVSGEHDVYFVYKGGSGYLFNVDWWEFSGAGGKKGPDEEGFYFRSDFENGSDNWSGRGSAKVSVSDDTSFSGKNSVKVTGREASWNGVSKKLPSIFKAGEKYSFSANVKYTDGEAEDKFHFTFQYTGSDNEVYYQKIDTQNVPKGEWVQLSNTSFEIPEGAYDMYIYVETDSSDIDFYADDICAAVEGKEIEGAGVPKPVTTTTTTVTATTSTTTATTATTAVTTTEKPAEKYTLGDLNSDGAVDAFDVILARKTVLDYISDKEIDDNVFAACNMNGDEKLSIADLVTISSYVLGK